MNDEDEGAKSNDSEPEMFENVMETSVRPQIIDSDSDASEDPTPIKKPPPPKRKLGPKPAASTKRKIVSSDSESSPVKKKVKSIKSL